MSKNICEFILNLFYTLNQTILLQNWACIEIVITYHLIEFWLDLSEFYYVLFVCGSNYQISCSLCCISNFPFLILLTKSIVVVDCMIAKFAVRS